MPPDWTPIALGVVLVLLVAWVVFAGIAPMLRRRRDTASARAQMSKAIAEGSDTTRSPADRAQAFRAAARTALEDLRRPRLAARYAEWAHRLAPGDADGIGLAVSALTASRRYHALERMLWTSLAASAAPRSSPALLALEKLYDQHLHRKERADALRALAAEAGDVTGSPRADA